MSTEHPEAVTRQRRWMAWVPAAAVACAIFGLSSIPGQSIPGPWVPGMDKLVHAAVYAVLGATIAHGLHKGRGMTAGLRVVLATMVIGGLYGASDEVHQLFTPNRSFEVLDGLADTVGSLLGAAAYLAWTRSRGRSGTAG